MKDEKLEKKFRQYAQKEKETLKKHGKSENEFVKEAMQWSKSIEGKLELDKFLLSNEILHIEDQIDALKKKRDKKQKAVDEINDEINNL